MHKLNIDNYRKNKLVLSKLEPLLLIDMAFLGDLKKQKIKFNPKPFSNLKNNKNKTLNQKPNDKTVDIHLNLIKRIDDLIQENKESTKIVHEPIYLNAKHINSQLSNIVEIRESKLKKPEMPLFRNELKPNNFNDDIRQREEFFEIEFQKVNTNEKENNEEGLSWMLDGKEAKKTLKGSDGKEITSKEGENKMQSKEENDSVTKTKLELEMTKKEIEEKKLALEKALKEEKQKEIEFKRIKELKLKEEKLKNLELKKKIKEDKIRQRELLKLQKEKEKLLKKQEKIKPIEPEVKNIDLPKKETEFFDTETLIDNKKEIFKETQILDQDVVKLMSIIDSLFDNLPENIVQEFVQSKDFEIYEKVMLKYKNKG